MAALGSGSRSAGLRNLAVAMMILLLVDPFLGRSIGFALSVLACAGIVWWARSWTVIMNRWLPLIISESIAVPLAAQLATIPLVAAVSARVSISGLAANALSDATAEPQFLSPTASKLCRKTPFLTFPVIPLGRSSTS